MTSNTAESINHAIKGIRELPVTSLIESLRCTVQKWYYTNKQAALSTFITLSTTAEKRLLSNINKSRKLKVSNSPLYLLQPSRTNFMTNNGSCIAIDMSNGYLVTVKR